MPQKVTIFERTDNKRWSDEEMQSLSRTLKTESHRSSDTATFLLLLGEWSTGAVEKVVYHTNFKVAVVDLIDENFAPLSFDIMGYHKVIKRYLNNLL